MTREDTEITCLLSCILKHIVTIAHKVINDFKSLGEVPTYSTLQ